MTAFPNQIASELIFDTSHAWYSHVEHACAAAKEKGYVFLQWNGHLYHAESGEMGPPIAGVLLEQPAPSQPKPLDVEHWRSNLRGFLSPVPTASKTLDYLATLVCTLGDRINALEARDTTHEHAEIPGSEDVHESLHASLARVVKLAVKCGWDVARLQDEVHAYWETRDET